MLVDNGPPWGSSVPDVRTMLEAKLLRHGIAVHRGRPYHPQPQGKIERFHRTVRAEAVQGRSVPDRTALQTALDRYRVTYNHERLHQGIGDRVPASRYTPSRRPSPTTLPPLVYAEDVETRIVRSKGRIQFRGRAFQIGNAFRGEVVGIRPTTTTEVFTVLFASFAVATITLTDTPK